MVEENPSALALLHALPTALQTEVSPGVQEIHDRELGGHEQYEQSEVHDSLLRVVTTCTPLCT